MFKGFFNGFFNGEYLTFISLIRLKEWGFFSMLLLVITINTNDFISDLINGEDWLHIMIEVITVGLSVWGIFFMIDLILTRHKQQNKFDQTLDEIENDLALTRVKLKEIGSQYSIYIHRQFDDWTFSDSEKEVAMLLLKGLSFKEIADVRNTKEKTARSQASRVYSKSNVIGRHEFAAWFFEDMLV